MGRLMHWYWLLRRGTDSHPKLMNWCNTKWQGLERSWSVLGGPGMVFGGIKAKRLHMFVFCSMFFAWMPPDTLPGLPKTFQDLPRPPLDLDVDHFFIIFNRFLNLFRMIVRPISLPLRLASIHQVWVGICSAPKQSISMDQSTHQSIKPSINKWPPFQNHPARIITDTKMRRYSKTTTSRTIEKPKLRGRR